MYQMYTFLVFWAQEQKINNFKYKQIVSPVINIHRLRQKSDPFLEAYSNNFFILVVVKKVVC